MRNLSKVFQAPRPEGRSPPSRRAIIFLASSPFAASLLWFWRAIGSSVCADAGFLTAGKGIGRPPSSEYLLGPFPSLSFPSEGVRGLLRRKVDACGVPLSPFAPLRATSLFPTVSQMNGAFALWSAPQSVSDSTFLCL